MKSLIKNGRIVTDVDDYHADIFIDGETVTTIGKTLKDAMTGAEEKAAQDAATAAASRDNEVAAQGAFHDFVLGAKTQVKA